MCFIPFPFSMSVCTVMVLSLGMLGTMGIVGMLGTDSLFLVFLVLEQEETVRILIWSDLDHKAPQ